METFTTALWRFMIGDTSISQAKAEILRAFPAAVSTQEAMLRADYVEDVAMNVRCGRTALLDAVTDLEEIRATELICYPCNAQTLH